MASRGTKRFSISRALLLLISINTIMSLGMNLANSLWPLYVKSLGATVLQLSYFVSMTGMIGTLVRIPSGVISDLWGRRKIIVASILLAVFPPFLYTLSDHWQQLIPWAAIYSIAFALYIDRSLNVLTTYYGIASGLAYETNPLWTDINTNPSLMLIGLSAVSLLGLLSYLLQPVISSRARNEWERNFCIKAIDWCFYISIFINVFMMANNPIQMMR